MSDGAQQRESGGESAAQGQDGPAAGGPGPDAGPGSTIASGDVLGPSAEPSSPSVHDQQTLTSLPSAGDGGPPPVSAPSSYPPAPPAAPANPGTPWSPPAAPPRAPGGGTGPGAGGGGSAYGGAFPAPAPHGGAGAGGPFPATPLAPWQPYAAPPPGTPSFPPPTVAGGPSEAVPPPPIAPGGPGPVAYGYPGAYGTAAVAPQTYYGWGGAPLPNNGPGTAAMVLGIVSAAGFCLWPAAIVVGVLAVIFGAVGRAKAARGEATNGGQALAGLICGAVGTVLAIAFGAIVLFT